MVNCYGIFHFERICETGLGRRIALHFVKLFGKKTLGLAYSIVGCRFNSSACYTK
ncbi:anion permease [Staphylococcus aureus]